MDEQSIEAIAKRVKQRAERLKGHVCMGCIACTKVGVDKDAVALADAIQELANEPPSQCGWCGCDWDNHLENGQIVHCTKVRLHEQKRKHLCGCRRPMRLTPFPALNWQETRIIHEADN